VGSTERRRYRLLAGLTEAGHPGIITAARRQRGDQAVPRMPIRPRG
jgi:hypothetical protein